MRGCGYGPSRTLRQEALAPAKERAHARPMPLVDLQNTHFILLTFSESLANFSGDETSLVVAKWTSDWLFQIIMHDFAEAKRKVSKDVNRGNDLKNRQLGNGCQSVR